MVKVQDYATVVRWFKLESLHNVQLWLISLEKVGVTYLPTSILPIYNHFLCVCVGGDLSPSRRLSSTNRLVSLAVKKLFTIFPNEYNSLSNMNQIIYIILRNRKTKKLTFYWQLNVISICKFPSTYSYQKEHFIFPAKSWLLSFPVSSWIYHFCSRETSI